MSRSVRMTTRTTTSSPTASAFPPNGSMTGPSFVNRRTNSRFSTLSGPPSNRDTLSMSSRYCHDTLPQLTPLSVFLRVICDIVDSTSVRTNRCS